MCEQNALYSERFAPIGERYLKIARWTSVKTSVSVHEVAARTHGELTDKLTGKAFDQAKIK